MVNTRPSPATSHPYAPQSAAVGGGTRQALSEQQRSQILSSLLQDPNQQTKGSFPQSQPQRHRQQQAAPSSRPQQAFHPSQQHPSQQGVLDPQFLAEQQSILRSIQENNARGGGHHQQSRPQPVQYADSWTNWGRDAWGGDRASTIPEEDEEYEDEGEYEGEWVYDPDGTYDDEYEDGEYDDEEGEYEIDIPPPPETDEDLPKNKILRDLLRECREMNATREEPMFASTGLQSLLLS